MISFKRIVFLQWFVLAIGSIVHADTPAAAPAAVSEPPPMIAAPAKKGAKPGMSAEMRQRLEAMAKKADDFVAQPKMRVGPIPTRTPFILKAGLDDFPPRPAAEVRIFDGTNQFVQVARTEKLAFCPIAEFASTFRPDDEPAFRTVLAEHASSVGADFVVIMTEYPDIKPIFHPKFPEELLYCAVAYKRLGAQLGIVRDEVAAKKGETKVAGFKPGSKAAASGLREGDIIKKIDEETPGLDEAYWRKAAHWKVGDKVKVEVERDGKTLSLEVELTAG